VKLTTALIGAATILMMPLAAQAQTIAPAAPVDQAVPATPAPPEPAAAAAAPAAEAPAAAPAVASAADGVTMEGGKYMKDGRKATKVEVAEYKKAGKARHE
jgi:hypothetical protein